jgi:hypothetical protein
MTMSKFKMKNRTEPEILSQMCINRTTCSITYYQTVHAFSIHYIFFCAPKMFSKAKQASKRKKEEPWTASKQVRWVHYKLLYILQVYININKPFSLIPWQDFKIRALLEHFSSFSSPDFSQNQTTRNNWSMKRRRSSSSSGWIIQMYATHLCPLGYT